MTDSSSHWIWTTWPSTPAVRERLWNLTDWGQVMHICISKLTVMGSGNGLVSGWCQAIISTNDGILLIGLLGTNFNEISIKIHIFSVKKIHFKMLSEKWHPFCVGLNMLIRVMYWLELYCQCQWDNVCLHYLRGSSSGKNMYDILWHESWKLFIISQFELILKLNYLHFIHAFLVDT